MFGKQHWDIKSRVGVRLNSFDGDEYVNSWALEALAWYWGNGLVYELVVLWPLLSRIVRSVGALLSRGVEVVFVAICGALGAVGGVVDDAEVSEEIKPERSQGRGRTLGVSSVKGESC